MRILDGVRWSPRSISRLMLSLMTARCAAQRSREAKRGPAPTQAEGARTGRKVKFLSDFTWVVGHRGRAAAQCELVGALDAS